MGSTAAMTYVRRDGIRTLGICWIIYGILRLICALAMVFFSDTARVMFGVLLVRVPDPFTLMNLFRGFYFAAIAFSVWCSVLSVFAGLMLLGGRRVARMLAIACAIFCLCDIPLGTTLGIYTLVVLLPYSAASPEST